MRLSLAVTKGRAIARVSEALELEAKLVSKAAWVFLGRHPFFAQLNVLKGYILQNNWPPISGWWLKKISHCLSNPPAPINRNIKFVRKCHPSGVGPARVRIMHSLHEMNICNLE